MMFMGYLLPTRILGSIEDGAFIKALEFCKKTAILVAAARFMIIFHLPIITNS